LASLGPASMADIDDEDDILIFNDELPHTNQSVLWVWLLGLLVICVFIIGRRLVRVNQPQYYQL